MLSDVDMKKLAIASELIVQSARSPDLAPFMRNIIPYGIAANEIAPYIAIKTGESSLALNITGARINEILDGIGPEMTSNLDQGFSIKNFPNISESPLNDAIGIEALLNRRPFRGINSLIKSKAARATLDRAETVDMAIYNILLDGLSDRDQYARALSHGPSKVREMYEAGLNAGYVNETLQLLATQPKRWEGNRGAGAGSVGRAMSWGQHGDSTWHRL